MNPNPSPEPSEAIGKAARAAMIELPKVQAELAAVKAERDKYQQVIAGTNLERAWETEADLQLARAEIERLKGDEARLDWLETNKCEAQCGKLIVDGEHVMRWYVWRAGSDCLKTLGIAPTLREAISAAMARKESA